MTLQISEEKASRIMTLQVPVIAYILLENSDAVLNKAIKQGKGKK